MAATVNTYPAAAAAGGSLPAGTGLVDVVGGVGGTYTTDGIVKMTTGVPGAAVAGTDVVVPGGAGAVASLTAGRVAVAASATGLTNYANLTNDGTTVVTPVVSGSVASAGTLALSSTTHATKGSTTIGGTAGITVDEANGKLGYGAAPVTSGGTMQVVGGGSPNALSVATTAVVAFFKNSLSYIVAKNTANSVEAYLCATTNSVQFGSHTSHPMTFIVGNGSKGQLNVNGDWVIGATGALATTATGGFILVPGGAGPPTGVPTGSSGKVPLYYDTTNDKLYAYNSAWKSTAALT